MQFNEKLRELRLRKGISQAVLAEKIFVSRSAVAKWENGFGLPSDDSLNRLADFFDVTPSELLSDPTNETVIVTKNNVISRQKFLIVSISIFTLITAFVLIALCGYFAMCATAPTISRHLIFETEKELNLEGLANYPDDKISIDCPFAKSRTFEIQQSVGAIRLPKLLVKTTVNDSVSYESVDSSNVIFTCSKNILLRFENDQEQEKVLYVNVLPTEYYAVEFCEWANIKYGDLFISIKVFRNGIAVENISVSLFDGSSEIGLTQRKALLCDIKPYNANDTDCVYMIDSIIRLNGEKYEGDLSKYAYIDKNNLATTKNIEIGSVINLFAETDRDNVRSNVFAVTVMRIEIERIALTLPNLASYIYLGESVPLTLTVYPANASFNMLEEQAEITILTPKLGELKQSDGGWLLTATIDIGAVGKKIGIQVETPEGTSKIFYWEISDIPQTSIESITLINLETGNELDEVTYINQNSTLYLKGSVFPENAIYDKINYNVFVDMPNFGRYVQFSDEGILTVSADAPNDMESFISATVGGVSSKGYKIVISRR